MKKLSTVVTIFFFLVVVVAIFFFLVVTATPSPAFKGERDYVGAGPEGCGDPVMTPGLNLTDEQTTKINALRIAHLKDIKPLTDKMFSKRGDLRLLWLNKNPDRAKILTTQREINRLEGKIQEHKTLNRLSVLKALTPEQKDKIRPYGGAPGFGPDHKGFGFAQHLNLSKEQMDTLRESSFRFDTETKTLRNNLAMQQMEMRKLFADPKIPEATLLAKQKDINTLKQQLIDKKTQMMIEDRKILTPEQITKLDKMPPGPGFPDQNMMDGDMMQRGMRP